ncbi:MAG TPA: methyltransferase [Ktedonobacter sp.]|nr:methyltransferase [Ktedonobacter sp.]HCP75903.1 methyltransferase [Ktedonobacter sp.]
MSKLQHAEASVNMNLDWKDLIVAPDGTHHIIHGNPAYHARFDVVSKFHAPGLAPVKDSSGAYHINSNGRAAYQNRYIRTFGFYEGRAALQANKGWFHILADGRPLYSARYDWCGNFQEGRCTVRRLDGSYFHMRHDGQPAYPDHYRYAGDYRDGIAVVQHENGLHTHVNKEGDQLHQQWFLDLDVFHKGYARARDSSGWYHINLRGQPAYQQRFLNIEPFYNGQARVDGFNGALFIINEIGETVLRLREGSS